MKKATLVKLHLRNFKKLKNVTLEFDPRLTTIQADNGVGKTTVFDAFNWVLFGKNHDNKSDFSIKTLDEHNEPARKLEHEVTAVVDVDGTSFEFKRVYKEKYTKKRNAATEEFTGHVEEFYINDVPKTLSEYNGFVNELFQTQIFRMVTDPTYFNEVLKWEQRRKILVEIAGHVTPEMILSSNPDLTEIQGFKTLSEISDKKKEIDSRRKKCKEEYDTIPARLDELDQQFKTDLTSEKQLNETLLRLNEKLSKKQDALSSDSAKAFEENNILSRLQIEKGNIQRQIQEEIQREQLQVNKVRNEAIQQVENSNHKIQSIKSKIELKRDAISAREKNAENLKETYAELNLKFNQKNAEVFDSVSGTCPSCQQSLPESMIEIKKTTFNSVKADTLNRLKREASECVEKRNKFKNEIFDLQNEINELELDLKTVENDLLAISIPQPIQVERTAKTDELNTRIKEIDEQLANRPKIDNAEIKNEIQAIQNEIKAVNDELSKHGFNKQIKERQDELINRQRSLMEILGDIEKIENQISKFSKLYMEHVETSVNALFGNSVKYKMFEQQINGGEKPTCICLVNGVPYPDVNTAGQINAGLTVINALQAYFGLLAPVFIDNRERVTNIIPMQNQIINLEKVSGVQKLTIQ